MLIDNGAMMYIYFNGAIIAVFKEKIHGDGPFILTYQTDPLVYMFFDFLYSAVFAILYSRASCSLRFV